MEITKKTPQNAQQNAQQTASQKKIPLVKGACTFKLHIPQNVEAKIRHLCSLVHEVEWSGVLFYRYKGNFDDGSFEATCVDIFVMDIGSSGYTEFKESPDIISYRIDHDLLDSDVQEALIHSHNTFNAFFSGTDINTLTEEGSNSNHFLSLIVNNEGSYVARVTRKVTTERKLNTHIVYTDTKYYNSYGDNKIVLEEETTKEEDKEENKVIQVVEYYDLDIIKEEAPNQFDELDERLSSIKASKSKSKYPYSQGLSTVSKHKETSWKKGTDDWYNDPYYDDYYTPKGPSFNFSDSCKTTWTKNEETSVKNEPKEQSLFPEDYTNLDPNNEEVPLFLVEEFDEKLVKELSIQLLTGSIIVNSNSINVNNWISKMDNVYEKRFGKLFSNNLTDKEEVAANVKTLKSWIESMLEILVYTPDKNLKSRLNSLAGTSIYDDTDISELCAFDMYNYINDLPHSKVKDIMLEVLNTYLPYGSAEYL